jgi:xanthine dehydrogenase small subunit
MRDYILLYINGREHKLRGSEALMPLSDYLRLDLAQCGTKVVCAEGDCGACSVMLGRRASSSTATAASAASRATAGSASNASSAITAASKGYNPAESLTYVPVNSCIQFVYQLDLAHIITVEGLKVGSALNAVQQSMVDCNGAQCGYCTPGFVVAMCGLANELRVCDASVADGKNGKNGKSEPPVSVMAAGKSATLAKAVQAAKTAKNCLSEKQVKDALTGNLCRCTGYEAIIKSGMDFDLNKFEPFATLYDEKPIIAAFKAHAGEPVLIECPGRKIFLPTKLDSAVQFLDRSAFQKEKVTIVAGGTDISVNINKRGLAPPVIMSLCNLSGLDEIAEQEVDGRKVVTVGAKVTLSRLERYFEKAVPQFHQVLWVYGSPQIRQVGTLAGNIGNGSPIADSLPFLFAVDADVEVTGPEGSRTIPIQSFYTGYKTLAMDASEMITRIVIPLPKADEVLRLYKITKRQHLDISSFTAAIVVKVKHDKIAHARVILGGVGPVVMRLAKVEEFLLGKVDKLDTYKGAGRMARNEIEPIDDVRGSREFRLQLAENIFQKFFYEMHESKEKVHQ